MFLLLVIVAINIIVAARFYNIDRIRLGDFFFAQGKENGLFDPNVRY